MSVSACKARGGDAEQLILEIVDRYYAHSSAADWTELATLFWPGATLTTIWRSPSVREAGVIATTVEELTRQGRRLGDARHFEEWRIGADVRVAGNLAHAWVRHGARRRDDAGDEQEWSAADGFTLMALDGEWRITAVTFDGGNHHAKDR